MSTKNTELMKQVEEAPVMTGFKAVLAAEMTKAFKTMKSVVPAHVTPERLARVALSTISRTPKLAECTVESLVGSIMNASTLGLEIGLLGHAHVVPFWNGKIKRFEAQFIIGYKGAIELFRRTGEVSVITAREVYEKDEFSVHYGTDEKIIHNPVPLGGERGKVIGYYAVYKLVNGAHGFHVASLEEMEQHRDRYAKSRKKSGEVFGPWKDHFDEMAKKTCIFRMAKYMPISVEKQESRLVMEAMAKDSGVLKIKDAGLGEPFIEAEHQETPKEAAEKKIDEKSFDDFFKKEER